VSDEQSQVKLEGKALELFTTYLAGYRAAKQKLVDLQKEFRTLQASMNEASAETIDAIAKECGFKGIVNEGVWAIDHQFWDKYGLVFLIGSDGPEPTVQVYEPPKPAGDEPIGIAASRRSKLLN